MLIKSRARADAASPRRISDVASAAQITILGEKTFKLEAGASYSDSAVCNPGGRKLTNCAYYTTSGGNVALSGLPGNNLPNGCTKQSDGQYACSPEAPTATCLTDAPCNVPKCTVNAGGRKVCTTTCPGAGKTGCKKYLLKPAGGIVQIDRDRNGAAKAFRYNVGTYKIKYGRAGIDTCVWATDRQGGTSCERILTVTDTQPPLFEPFFNESKAKCTPGYGGLSTEQRMAKEECYDFYGVNDVYEPG